MSSIKKRTSKLFSHTKQASNTEEDILSDSEDLDQRRLAQLQKEYEEAEKAAGEEGGEGEGEGNTGNARPNFGKRGSFLNRLIQSGNKRTEDQLARMSEGNGQGEKR